MTEQPDQHDEPTNAYTMRHAANELSRFVNRNRGAVPDSKLEAVDFAYQQLLRGANTIRQAQAAAYDEGFTACAGEHTKQLKDPAYPITRTNPYEAA